MRVQQLAFVNTNCFFLVMYVCQIQIGIYFPVTTKVKPVIYFYWFRYVTGRDVSLPVEYYVTGGCITLSLRLFHYRLIIILPVERYITDRLLRYWLNITVPIDCYNNGRFSTFPVGYYITDRTLHYDRLLHYQSIVSLPVAC